MSELLKRLNEINDIKITSVYDDSFKMLGKVHKGYELSKLIEYMETKTTVPNDGNIYVPSVADMESTHTAEVIKSVIYGGMPIQIGYCNGQNSTYNGFEYHKCSEINIAITDMMLVLGHRSDIKNCHFDNNDARVFFVPRMTMIEMYDTTLHLSPLKVSDYGFKAIVVLTRGTNEALSDKDKLMRDKVINDLSSQNEKFTEERLLLAKNKWVIAHPDREPLIKQGAYPGVIGANKEIYYN